MMHSALHTSRNAECFFFVYIQLCLFLKKEKQWIYEIAILSVFVCAVVLPFQHLNQLMIITTFGVNVMTGVSNALPASLRYAVRGHISKLYAYVYIYTYIYVCMYIYIYVCIYI